MPRAKGWEDVDGTNFSWREDSGGLMLYIDDEPGWIFSPEDAIDIGTELVKWGKENKE